jgi:hypothetical protein
VRRGPEPRRRARRRRGAGARAAAGDLPRRAARDRARAQAQRRAAHRATRGGGGPRPRAGGAGAVPAGGRGAATRAGGAGPPRARDALLGAELRGFLPEGEHESWTCALDALAEAGDARRFHGALRDARGQRLEVERYARGGRLLALALLRPRPNA